MVAHTNADANSEKQWIIGLKYSENLPILNTPG
jgi:hypothetical protein